MEDRRSFSTLERELIPKIHLQELQMQVFIEQERYEDVAIIKMSMDRRKQQLYDSYINSKKGKMILGEYKAILMIDYLIDRYLQKDDNSKNEQKD